MEMKIPAPKTNEMVWSPKLVPSCQTPVKDGMEVRFNTPGVESNQRHVMEYLLINHPLDCPICDQAGECWLQDYSLFFGAPNSRMLEPKIKNPKKDVGPYTFLYQDRCILCSRCVRFCREIAGTGELCVADRGSRCEIECFPGVPLTNKLQGNVVDICPVGSLLDKKFLMQQRAWLLTSVESVCPRCSRGCTIRIDHNLGRVWRLMPRFNPHVNHWWMCDEGRFCWDHVYDDRRVKLPRLKRGSVAGVVAWKDVPGIVRTRFDQIGRQDGGKKIGVVLSPFMGCEEAWLLTSFVRGLAPDAVLTMVPPPVVGKDEVFPVGSPRDRAKFVISAEKAPNRRGIEAVIQAAGGRSVTFDEFVAQMNGGGITAACVVDGSPDPWENAELVKAAARLEYLVVEGYLNGLLAETAAMLLPMCAWAEREGSFINDQGLLQRFQRAVPPPGGLMPDGQYLFEIAGHHGVYNAGRVRQMMADAGMKAFAATHEAPREGPYAH
jgi:NADH-quinone oxidoreductase subunit G